MNLGIESASLHPLWLIAATFSITLLPLLVGATTSYLKISVVLSLLRSGLGLQQSPNALVVMVLSLALSLLVMGPVLRETTALMSSIDGAALKRAPSSDSLAEARRLLQPWREFLEAHAGARECETLAALVNRPVKEEDSSVLPLDILIPAFILSELKAAFSMGFLLLLPFLVVDLIVANILAGLGMYLVSPTMISLPLKLLLFVSVDGWLLLCRSLVLSYGGGGVS